MKREAESSKLDQTVKILEKKAKVHEENIQGMKNELEAKEEEIEVQLEIPPFCSLL